MYAKETELAYSRWLFSLASGYLHNVGNAVTAMGAPLIDLKHVIKYSAQYPRIFERLKKGGPEADALMRRFEEVLVGQIVPTLGGVADSIAGIQEAIRVSIRHQQDGFRSAVRQASEPVDLSALLASLCKLLANQHKQFEFKTEPEIKVRSFRIQLWQGLDNVIRNAIHATKGKQPIHVFCESNENGAKVIVVDEGEGIAPQDLPRVMTPGFTTRGQGGTGLGLHSFAVFLAATGGGLRVESEGLGRGCKVTVEVRNAD